MQGKLSQENQLGASNAPHSRKPPNKPHPAKQHSITQPLLSVLVTKKALCPLQDANRWYRLDYEVQHTSINGSTHQISHFSYQLFKYKKPKGTVLIQGKPKGTFF